MADADEAVMNSDKELADKVVALGIDALMYVDLGGYCDDWVREFVRNWRVAGALMERCLEVDQVIVGREDGQFFCDLPTKFPFDTYYDDSLPRAIIEAAVKALS